MERITTRAGFKLKFCGGFWISADDDHIVRHLLPTTHHYLGRGTYQFRQLRACLKIIPKDRRRVALDVGAHVGTWTRVLAQEFERVIAFEAFPVHVECLRLNVPNTNVEIIPGIVSEHAGVAKFLTLCLKPGMSRVDPLNKTGIDLNCHTLDSILLDCNPVDFIKADVEGHELQVMRGAEEMLRRCKPWVCIEQKDLGKDYNPGQSRFATAEFLAGLGAHVIGHVNDDYMMGW